MSRFHYFKQRHTELKFPVRYYRHQRSGVVVEVEAAGVCTLNPLPGPFRSFARMKDGNAIYGRPCWEEADEIGVLVKHGWQLVQP
jgi:hypothetical protein